MAMGKGLRVSHKPQIAGAPGPYSLLLEQRNREESLLFECGAIAALSPAETEAIRKQYTRLLDVNGCLGILQLNASDAQIQYLALVTGCTSVGKIGDNEIFRVTNTQFVSLRGIPGDEERVMEARRLFNAGTFYFNWCPSLKAGGGGRMDLTLCEQRRGKTKTTDNRFFWNRILHLPFRQYGVEVDCWLLKVICGAVEMRTVYVGHRQAKACLISRLSCERAGTRFQTRGTNDDGSVANFVETEQVLYLEDQIASHIQVRGSVPLFWEQPGVQVGSHKVKLSRGAEASAPAFALHLSALKKRYGKQVIVNLLSCSLIGSRADEAKLSQLYQSHHRACPQHKDVPHILFDYHAEIRDGNSKKLENLKHRVIKSLETHGFFHADGSEIRRQQIGTHRTNCLDCLDRTNCVQTYIGLLVLSWQLEVLKLHDKPQVVSRFQECYRSMWINTGNEISKIYAGTGALQGGSKLVDGARSVTRTIQNNLYDVNKQEAINLILLGNALKNELADQARMFLSPEMLHASPDFLREMCRRLYDFSHPLSLVVAVGTYNVNGGKHFRSIVYKDRSLADWLLDARKLHSGTALIGNSVSEEDDRPPDIYAIGFQEMVDLNAQNIMSASTENAKAWEQELSKTLNRDNEYILLTSVQLVGVCLFIFMRPNLAAFVRDVGTDSVKTGLGGAAGNKGAVAIRLTVHNSSMAFVCGHFAAGQNQVAERSSDYQEISHRLAFPMGRSLNSHDYIFWCGDFNYRVDLQKDEVKDMIGEKNWAALLEYDQLRSQQKEGQVFNGFFESDINFPPTYKYDLFSDDYDTSEKCRVPAWTDRVLWRRRKSPWQVEYPDYWSPGHGLFYGRAELKQSDHRPVIGILEIQINAVDPQQRKLVLEDVTSKLGPADGTVLVSGECSPEEFDDEFVAAFLTRIEREAIGEVIMVRFTEVGEMSVTFSEGKEALEALAVLDEMELEGVKLRARLRTPNWHQLIQEELHTNTSYAGVVALQPTSSMDSNPGEPDVLEGELKGEADDVLGEAPPRMPSLKEMHADYYTSVDDSIFDDETLAENEEDGDEPVVDLATADLQTPPAPPARPAPPRRPAPPPSVAANSREQDFPEERSLTSPATSAPNAVREDVPVLRARPAAPLPAAVLVPQIPLRGPSGSSPPEAPRPPVPPRRNVPKENGPPSIPQRTAPPPPVPARNK